MTDSTEQTADPANSIAYQGVPGANSHIACLEAFPDMIPLACGTFEDAFAAVETDGRAALAMIPIENSLGGRVADIHHLLPESNLYIVREHYLPVKYQLLALEGAGRAHRGAGRHGRLGQGSRRDGRSQDCRRCPGAGGGNL
jgi:prephenate dehydratase